MSETITNTVTIGTETITSTVNVAERGATGATGPNSVTSATTFDGTANITCASITSPLFYTSGLSLFDDTGIFWDKGAASAYIKHANVTGAQEYQLPDASGTFALTSDITAPTAAEVLTALEAMTSAQEIDSRAAIASPVYSSPRLMAGLKAAMDAGLSCGIAVYGDSTSDEALDTIGKFILELKTAYPNYAFLHKQFDDSSWNTLYSFTPASGLRHWHFPSNTGNQVTLGVGDMEIPATADIAIEIKMRVTNWTAGIPRTALFAGLQDIPPGTAADRIVNVGVTVGSSGAKRPALSWYDSGGNLKSQVVQASLPFNDNDIFWLRIEFDVDNGSGTYAVKAYHRTADSGAWTHFGTGNPVTPATTSMRTIDPASKLTGYQIGYQYFDIFDFLVYDHLVATDPPMLHTPVDNWRDYYVASVNTLVGAPLLTIWNCSKGGKQIYDYADTTYATYIAPDVIFPMRDTSILAGIVNLGHNQQGSTTYIQSPGGFVPLFSTAFANLVSRFPNVEKVLFLQNPEQEVLPTWTQKRVDQHESNLVRLRQEAIKNNWSWVDIYRSYTESGMAISALLTDYVHPNDAGYTLSGATIMAGFNSR